MKTASPNNIHIINNFIPESDLQIVCKYLDSYDSFEKSLVSLDGKIETYGYYKIASFENADEDVIIIMNSYISKALEKIEYIFGDKVWTTPSLNARVWERGSYQEMHSDSDYNIGYPLSTEENNVDAQSIIPNYLQNYNSILYLNDNYDGGELVFPDYEIEIKPKVGDFICFPSNSKYLHRVNKILSGTRYTMANGWYGKRITLASTLNASDYIKSMVKDFTW